MTLLSLWFIKSQHFDPVSASSTKTWHFCSAALYQNKYEEMNRSVTVPFCASLPRSHIELSGDYSTVYRIVSYSQAYLHISYGEISIELKKTREEDLNSCAYI